MSTAPDRAPCATCHRAFRIPNGLIDAHLRLGTGNTCPGAGKAPAGPFTAQGQRYRAQQTVAWYLNRGDRHNADRWRRVVVGWDDILRPTA